MTLKSQNGTNQRKSHPNDCSMMLVVIKHLGFPPGANIDVTVQFKIFVCTGQFSLHDSKLNEEFPIFLPYLQIK